MRDRLPVVFAVLALTACQTPAPGPFPTPADPAGRTASTILRECEDPDPDREMRCHESAVLDVLREEGVAAAMAVTERMGDLDADVKREGHVYAHAIGLAAYTTPEEVGQVFSSCTPSFQSGCYHGVIQSYFVELARGDPEGVTAEAVNALCADQRGADGDRWLLFQCAHGVGHGVTMLHEHHLPRALRACDLVADEWERSACYGGAFMENIIQATAPHHTVGRPGHGGGGSSAKAHGAHAAGGHARDSEEAGHGEHGDHGEHGHGEHAEESGPAAAEFPLLRSDDPLYPCSVLDERYLPACYHMQTSAILYLNGGDVAAAAATCESAPDPYRVACFQSLGRDVSARTLQDHAEALELCALAGPRAYDCHWGYVKNVVDVTAEAADGFAFCRVVPDAEGKRRCYQAVGEQVWVLSTDRERRESMCAGAEPSFRGACRYGAGLSAERAGADGDGGEGSSAPRGTARP